MKHLPYIYLSLIFFSCNLKTGSSPESKIKKAVLNSEIEYFDRTIQLFSGESELGQIYFKADSTLNLKYKELKIEIAKNGKINSSEQNDFFEYFEKVIANSKYIDLDKFRLLKKMNIETESDIDFLAHYFKFCFVTTLQNTKSIPFDMFGTMSSADSWQIKNGNDFIVNLALTAANANRPTEWYQVKPGTNELTKENILDTLRPNEFGEITFKTRKYHVGTNQLKFVTKFRLPQGDRQIARTVTFLVK